MHNDMRIKAATAGCPHASRFSDLGGADPYAFYDDLRSKAPLVWDDSASGWLVTTYDECREVEINEDRFRHPYFHQTPDLLEIKGGETITVVQGEAHQRMHRFVMSLFAPKLIGSYREVHVRPIIDEILPRFLADGRAELTSQFTNLLPPRVILSLLDMPWQDDDYVHRVIELHDVMMAWASGLGGPGIIDEAKAASHALNDMLLPHVRIRRDKPGNDLISRVWSEWPREMGEVTEAKVMAVCREMFMAGSETTIHALANAFHILLTEPGVMQAVQTDRDTALANLVEETLRLYGAVQYRYRIANQDCELGGVQVKKDQVLVLINSAANRDPAHYEHPSSVDLARSRPRDHLAFNTGPRVCVGAALARAEMVDAISALLDQTRNLRVDPEQPGASFPGHFNRSFRPLHVLFDPA